MNHSVCLIELSLLDTLDIIFKVLNFGFHLINGFEAISSDLLILTMIYRSLTPWSLVQEFLVFELLILALLYRLRVVLTHPVRKLELVKKRLLESTFV